MPPPTGVVSGPLIDNAEIADGFHGVIGQPLLEFVEGFFAGEHFKPGNLALAAVDQRSTAASKTRRDAFQMSRPVPSPSM